MGYLMQHQYPFCVLMITTKEASVDVNVHPTKQEVRFDDEMAIADIFKSLIFERLHQREDIAEVTLDENVQAAPLRKTTENDATDPGE